MGISSGLGNAIVPTSYGFRNVIINGNFSINQRAYTSGSNLASGSYGFDRWKSNYTNTALTFTSAPQGQTVTISASGVIRQIVERANVAAGSYVLSWTGTATGRVYNSGASAPSYATGPLSVYLDGTADVIVEFTPASGTATLGQVQLEFGSRATPFEQRPIGVELALCQRYYISLTDPSLRGVFNASTSFGRLGGCLPVRMRTAPVVTMSGTLNIYDGSNVGTFTAIGSYYSTVDTIEIDSGVATGTFGINRPCILYVGGNGKVNCSSEL